MPDRGEKIGSFEVQRELGRGGMGVVYLARDTRLERLVAVKALPAHLTGDPDRLSRFQREAKVLASLSHSGIGAIHGLEEVDAQPYLILEYVDGETLAARLTRGPLPIDDAIAIATRIAEAVEAAHEKGVVHRDLKPGNIMLTPGEGVKVLDFGLARLASDAPSSITSPDAHSPTLTNPPPQHSPTIAGVIMGTAGYMSPEQARGKPVDQRSDVFSFGCVLYEMLTGARPFAGETVADVVGATLHKDLDLGLLPPETPPNVRRLLRRCLAKDKRDRLRDMGDVRLELVERDADPAPAARSRPVVPWAVAAIAVLLAVGLAALRPWGAPKPTSEGAMLAKFAVELTDDLDASGHWQRPVLSPDGRLLAIAGEQDSVWLRPMDQIEPHQLPLPWPAQIVGWSKDSRWLILLKGSTVGGEVWRIDPEGGSPLMLGTLPQGGFLWAQGGCVSADRDRVLLGMAVGGLFTMPLQGGAASLLLEPGPNESFVSPTPVPGTDAILFVETSKGRVEKLQKGERSLVFDFEGDRLHSVSYSRSGHLLVSVYSGQRRAGIWGIPFDVESLEATGTPFLVLPRGEISLSDNDTIVHSAWIPSPVVPRQLVWVTRSGEVDGAIGGPLPSARIPVLSPAGDRVAVSARADTGSEDPSHDIFIVDVGTGSRIQLTDNRGSDYACRWRRDGTALVFATWNAGIRDGREVDVDGSGPPRDLAPGCLRCLPSPDDRFLIVNYFGLVYYERGSNTPHEFTDQTADSFDISNDGRYVAYSLKAGGGSGIGIKLRRFPDGGALVPVTDLPAEGVRWSRDDSEITFWSGDDFMAVSVALSGPQPAVGTPQRLFSAKERRLLSGENYDLAPDGRYVMLQDPEETSEPPRGRLTIVQNWALEFVDGKAER